MFTMTSYRINTGYFNSSVYSTLHTMGIHYLWKINEIFIVILVLLCTASISGSLKYSVLKKQIKNVNSERKEACIR